MKMLAAVSEASILDNLQENVEAIDEDCAPQEELALQYCAVTHPPLDHSEQDQQQAEGYEGANDRPRAPRLRRTAPLKGKQIANYCSHDGKCAEWIHLKEFLSPACFDRFRRSWSLEEKEDDKGRCSADRQIHVEASNVSILDHIKENVAATHHHRHVALDVNTPPKRGPMTLATPYVAPRMPVNAARCFGGTAKAMIV